MKYLVLFREPDISQEVVENRYLWSTLLDVPSYGMVVEGGGCVLWLISLPPVFEADANGTKRIPVTNLSQLHKNSLVSVDPPSGQDPSLTEILLTDLKPDTQYNATIYSQAANGTEGQPRNKVFVHPVAVVDVARILLVVGKSGHVTAPGTDGNRLTVRLPVLGHHV